MIQQKAASRSMDTICAILILKVGTTNLGILFQDYALYHFLVKESIAIGRTANPLDIGKVRAAATSGEADQFISEWQEQYDQRLGKEFTGGC